MQGVRRIFRKGGAFFGCQWGIKVLRYGGGGGRTVLGFRLHPPLEHFLLKPL